ncbi:DTW domain-containing protein [Vibrio sp. FNV 38]|nr:DTW domain-containing protein [Vibrio sp. FNV 38]
MTTCPNCAMQYQCICSSIPVLESQIHIALVTHENELSRDTNTGQWAEKMLTNCQRYLWQRKSPPTTLIELINSGNYTPLLVFPDESSSNLRADFIANLSKPALLIVLDATWQEAKKMLNKSTWLNVLPRVHLESSTTSQYQLRRNQASGNLCTLEVVAELVALHNNKTDADKVAPFLDSYTKAFKADKCGHAYNGKK